MDVSTYVLLSQEQALRRRLDIIANNMANINTVGFRREQTVFQEYVDKNATPPAPGMTETSYVLDYGTVHDTSPGAFQPTGNPLDVMIDGPGYLTVQGPDGNPAYTRAGLLRLSPNGELTTAAGRPVLGANNNPIVIPLDQVGKVRIAEDGSVSDPQGEIGRLGLVSFQDERALKPLGDGMFSAQGAQPAFANVRIRSGGVEGSNVQPIIETTQMIEVMRVYQNSKKALDGIQDMRAKAIDKLGRIG